MAGTPHDLARRTSQPVIKILIVDDSAFMRKALTLMLESDPEIKVVGVAANGQEGYNKAILLKPDLITMDIEMPVMDGLTCLRKIMASRPTPVMMISSISTEGAKATLDALDAGAVDFIPKEKSFVSLDIVKIKEDLLGRIKKIARRKHVLMARFTQRLINTSNNQVYKPPVRQTVRNISHKASIVAIGSSTGGPPALQQVIANLPANFPVGVIISQHMPPTFTKSLAERLDSLSPLSVREAKDGEPILAGSVLIAPGGQHLTVRRVQGRICAYVTDKPDTLYKPCVDVSMHSVAEIYGGEAISVMLTGMGSNGVHGARAMKGKGGLIIAQNEETCVIYGMPRAVIEAQLTDIILPIDQIAGQLVNILSSSFAGLTKSSSAVPSKF